MSDEKLERPVRQRGRPMEREDNQPRKKRGRPPKKTATADEVLKAQADAAEHIEVRTPTSHRPKLLDVFHKDPKYHYHWWPESQIDKGRFMGYEVCRDKHGLMIHKLLTDGDPLGTVVRRREMILMFIPKEIYDQRQKEEQDQIDDQEKMLKIQQEQELRDKGVQGVYGNIDLRRGG